jgi:hypothetical protein
MTDYNDIESVLDKLRQNSSTLSNYHRKRYLVLKARLKYYRVPIIVVSACNSVGAVSLQPFLNQTYISLLNMFLSLIVGIIGSIEMFLQINRELESSLVNQKEFYILSCDIYKYLELERGNRITDERTFLQESYTRYIKLIETSYTLKKRIDDKLQDALTARIEKLAHSPNCSTNTSNTANSSNNELFVDTDSEENNLTNV